jgi:hypothetical protein
MNVFIQTGAPIFPQTKKHPIRRRVLLKKNNVFFTPALKNWFNFL